MNDNPLPQEDQQVTLISVREGNISVTSARTLVVKPHKIALELDSALSELPSWSIDQALTMIYTHGDRVMRLRATVREQIDQERVTVEPVGEVKEGDRRDFRRADVDARVYSKRSPTTSPSEARTLQLAESVPLSSGAFRRQVINISGSGLSFTSPEVYAMGELVDVRLVLDRPTNAMVTMIGHLVRAVPGEGGELGTYAIRFAELSESDQDLIVYTVFSNHFAAEGLGDALDLAASGDEGEDDI